MSGSLLPRFADRCHKQLFRSSWSESIAQRNAFVDFTIIFLLRINFS